MRSAVRPGGRHGRAGRRDGRWPRSPAVAERDGIERLHAVVHHQLDLADVVAVCEHADIATEAQCARRPSRRRLEAGALALGCVPAPDRDPFFHPAYCCVASPAARVGHNATPFSAISWKTSGVPSSPCSMVSTPGQRRAPHPVGGLGVRDHRTAAVLAISTMRRDRSRCERRTRLAARPPAIVRVHLDHIGAVTDLIARTTRVSAVDAVGLFGALRDRALGREALRAIAAGGDDGRRR